MYNLIIPCSLSHIIVPKYCYVGASLIDTIIMNCVNAETLRLVIELLKINYIKNS